MEGIDKKIILPKNRVCYLCKKIATKQNSIYFPDTKKSLCLECDKNVYEPQRRINQAITNERIMHGWRGY